MKSWIKRGMAGFVSVAMVMTLMPASALAEALDDDDGIEITPEMIAQMKDNDSAYEEGREVIEAVEEELFVNKDGQFELDDVKSLKREIGSKDLKQVEKALETVNSLEESGEIEITDNGTVFETSDNTLAIQGGFNRNYGWLNWWGITRYADYKSAKKLKTYYRSFGLAANSASSVAAITGCGAPVSLILLFAGVRATCIANSIGTYNKKGKGIKLELAWLVWYRVRTQSKSN